MASVYDDKIPTLEKANQPKEVTTVTAPVTTNSNQQSNTSQGTNTRSDTIGSSVTTNMSPEGMAALMNLIQTLSNGGTNQQKADITNRSNVQQIVQFLLQNYGKGNAISDAQALMAENLRQTLEANMPAISKSIEGAGTSASSMQGLLSQDLATRSAESAGALGAKQAVDYGQIAAALSSTLEKLSTPQNTVENTLVSALQALKGAVSTTNTGSTTIQNSTTNSNTNTTGSSTQSGGNITQTTTPLGGSSTDSMLSNGSNNNNVGNDYALAINDVGNQVYTHNVNRMSYNPSGNYYYTPSSADMQSSDPYADGYYSGLIKTGYTDGSNSGSSDDYSYFNSDNWGN